MPDPLRWGIMGTGNIARQFCTGLSSGHRSAIAAVGSRSEQSARDFAAQFKIPSVHGSYDGLLADPKVEAIYLSLPNSMHHEWTIKALNAGKHVLCEKPISVTAAQAEEMFDVAKRKGRVLVEAFMYRSHPQTRSILETIRNGELGEIKLIKTSFCYRTTKLNENIRFKPELAGGAMMDIGCYCLSFSRMIAGEPPASIQATGKLHPLGVDECAAGSLRYSNGIVASFCCGMTVQADNSAYVCGTEGYLEIPWPWKPQRKASYTIAHSTPPRQDAAPGATPQRPPRRDITVQANAELYALEADDFAATVQDGAAPMLSANETIDNMRALEQIRKQIGLPY
jgi:predicted dehydrogenase